MKKRVLSLCLALVMCVGLAVPAFAADSSCSVRFQAPLETPEKQPFTYTDTVIGLAPGVLDRFSYGQSYEWTGDVLPTPRSANIIVSGLGAAKSISVLASSKGSDGETYYQRAHSTEDGSTYIPLPISEDASGYPVYDPAKPDASLSNTALLEELGFDMTRDKDGSVTIPASRLYELYGAGSVIVLYEKSGPRIVVLLLAEEDAPAFTDLLPWCDDEAVWAAQQKITNGYGAKDKFAPGVDCTQVQILTFLWRAKKRPGSTATAFSDLAGDYAPAANWAYEEGMIDDSFNPNAPCTRAQAVTYIWKAQDEPEAKEAASFSDVEAGSPIAPAVSWAVEKGVTKGYGGADTFAPGRVCTRGEIACFLYRALHN